MSNREIYRHKETIRHLERRVQQLKEDNDKLQKFVLKTAYDSEMMADVRRLRKLIQEIQPIAFIDRNNELHKMIDEALSETNYVD